MTQLGVVPQKASLIEAAKIPALTKIEKFQIALVERCFEMHDSSTTYGQAERSGNIGIQHATIQYPACISALASNPKLHSALIPLILKESKKRTSHDVIQALSSNPVVLKNLVAFKLVLDHMRDQGMAHRIPEVLKVLFSRYPFHTSEAISIEIFLMIFAYIEIYHPDESYLLDIAKTIAETYSESLSAWIDLNMPDFADLPLSWVLKSYYDLYL